MSNPDDPGTPADRPTLRVVQGGKGETGSTSWQRFLERQRRARPLLTKAAVMGSRRPDVYGRAPRTFPPDVVCRMLQVEPHVLRYWESEFPQLAPVTDGDGRRAYRFTDLYVAMRIRDLLYDDKCTIAEARECVASDLIEYSAALEELDGAG